MPQKRCIRKERVRGGEKKQLREPAKVKRYAQQLLLPLGTSSIKGIRHKRSFEDTHFAYKLT